jgi:hypothetical protein
LFTPVFYVVMQRLSGLGKKTSSTKQKAKVPTSKKLAQESAGGIK